MDLHRTLLKDVILPKLKSVYVIDYYEGVRSLLESRADFPYKDIFANPRVRTRTDVTWTTDAFVSRPRLLSELKDSEKQYYSYLLYREIEALKNLVDTLKTESGGAPLSELLGKTISNVDEKSVYCADDRVVLVNWGMIPRQPGLDGASIFRSGNFVGGWDKVHSVNPRQDETDKSDKDTAETDIIPQTPEPEIVPADNDTVPQPQEINQTVSEVTDNTTEITVDSNTVDEPDFVDDTDQDETETVADVDNEKDVVEDELPAGETDKDNQGKKKSDYGWKDFFGGFLGGLVFLFRKLWWLLLLIILAVLLLLGFKDCQGPFSRVNPFYNPLPEKSVIMPVDSAAVGRNADGVMVATDRLNVILEKENDDTMLRWALAFKKAYPSSDIEIKYYNPATYVLQIKVPPERRLELKRDMKSKIPGFGFDVFEETLYGSEFMPNDPALSDRRAAWYIDAIGARDAWETTTGSEDVVVAVVDNGFDLDHPELQGKIVKPYNVLTQDDKLRPIITKEGVNGHGTHVAATAVGNADNGSGLLGIAPGCRLMPIQVGNDNPEGKMSNLAIFEGVMYAINNGADVVNVSIGAQAPEYMKQWSVAEQLNFIENTYKEDEAMWDLAFTAAERQNCIIVISAGNSTVISGLLDANKRDNRAFRVSAVAPGLKQASFSNYGRFLDIGKDYSTVSAPGVAIYSAFPGGKYAYLQGTSMAAPIVTGAVALLRSVNKNLTAPEAQAILQRTGRLINLSIGPLIDLSAALRSATGDLPPAEDCGEIRREIERLRARIDSLGSLCPGAAAPSDTLKFRDVIEDPRALEGLWKSTTQLYSDLNHKPIELYMSFKGLSGQLIIESDGLRYTAPLSVKVDGDNIQISQSESASCPDTEMIFVPYTYKCSPDRKGNLFCEATSSLNQVNFNLVRIK